MLTPNRPIFILLTLFYYSMSMSTSSTLPAGDVERDFHFKYTVQKGFFAQSEDETNDKEFDFVNSIPQSIPRKSSNNAR